MDDVLRALLFGLRCHSPVVTSAGEEAVSSAGEEMGSSAGEELASMLPVVEEPSTGELCKIRLSNVLLPG